MSIGIAFVISSLGFSLPCVETGMIEIVRRFRIYVDAVINHMTGEPPENYGTAGNTASYRDWYYPAVPYTAEHFNWPHCVIDGMDYVNNAWRVICYLIILLINHIAVGNKL